MIDLIYNEVKDIFTLTGASAETAALLELVAIIVSIFLVCAVLWFAYKLIAALIRLIAGGWRR